MKKTDKEILVKILEHAERLLKYSNGKTFSDFEPGVEFTDACIFNLLQIGEYVAALSESFILANPEIPWRTIKGMRNRIVHDYEGINYKTVWETVSKDIPIFIKQIERLTDK